MKQKIELIDDVKENYKFIEKIGSRCVLKNKLNEDYSISYHKSKTHSKSSCRGLYCSDCIFGYIKNKEELEKAKEYWYSQFPSLKIDLNKKLLLI